jgi:4-nitrophenyl phosphatase
MKNETTMIPTWELATIQAAVIDMDGVLWRGQTPMPGLADFFGWLRRRELPFVLATNNASKTPHDVVERLAGWGVDISPDEVLTSSIATAAHLAKQHDEGTLVYAIGGAGLRQALRSRGFRLIDGHEEAARLVVVGIDFDLTYDKLACAAVHVQRGATFVATNTDRSYPSELGRLPGAGAIVAAVETATGVSPDVIGKPHAAMFRIALERLATDPAHTVMIGDRLDTDILGGARVGMRTVLVTSGIDDRAAARAAAVPPDMVLDDIGALAAAWRASVGAVPPSP